MRGLDEETPESLAYRACRSHRQQPWGRFSRPAASRRVDGRGGLKAVKSECVRADPGTGDGFNVRQGCHTCHVEGLFSTARLYLWAGGLRKAISRTASPRRMR